MVLEGGGGEPPERPALPLPDKPSLAVLPFDNLSGDPEQGYFADGIVEDIITALSRVSGLFVIARNSSFAYRGQAVDVRQVGRELGVRYVLEGSVRKAGERVRITGQLIDAQSGAHLWAERFDGTLADVFDLQDRVAEGGGRRHRADAQRCRDRARPAQADREPRRLRPLSPGAAARLRAPRPRTTARRCGCSTGPSRSTRTTPWRSGSRLGATCTPTCAAGPATTRPSARPASGPPAGRSLRARTIPRRWLRGGFVLSLLAHDHEAGLAALDRARGAQPQLRAGFGSSALVHCFAGDYDTAIEHGQRALRLSPFDPLGYRPLIALAYADLFTGRPRRRRSTRSGRFRLTPASMSRTPSWWRAWWSSGGWTRPREAAGRLMAAFPTFRIARRRRAGFRDTARFEAYLAALRRAGLPD